jgi:hypothetical protein
VVIIPPVTAREIKSNEYAQWDLLIQDSPQGTIFHTSDWLSTSANSLDKKFRIFGCFENNQLVAGCSFYQLRQNLLRIALSSFPTTPYGGIVVAQPQTNDPKEQKQQLDQRIQSLRVSMENANYNYVQLTNSPHLTDVQQFAEANWKKGDRFTYYIDLNNFETKVTKEVRWSIRKAIENQVTIEQSNSINEFYKLLDLTLAHQQKSPFAPYVFYEKIFDYLRKTNRGELWIAKAKSGETCAAEIMVYDEKRAYRWSAASHYELRKTGAPSYLLHETLKTMRNKGFQEVDLVNGPSVPYVNLFLGQFRPKTVPFYCLEYQTSLAKTASQIVTKLNLKGKSN